MKALSFLSIVFLLLASVGCSDLLGNEELQTKLRKKGSIDCGQQTEGLDKINPCEPIFILDGKQMNDQMFYELNPDDIVSIEIIKAYETKKYGPKGEKNGVILIGTKKKAKD